ncbi:Antibiotic biosynthesis monooxygenase [Kingella potus]|uniref:Antibiotic biosynthesis monooxygenase n=1 Tax=Kingella potus TaxID=265175 RepID=A0A377R2S9_9NEIS|nr:antibiotic biosynthesis monooxygenase family protein [Kingella potus]STR02613.1 Antibiotic biosynthesis monooxygenase [Kingella potus]
MKFNLKKTALIGASAAAVLFAAVAVAQDAPRFGKGFGKHHSPFSQEAREKWCSPKRVTLINVFEVPKGSEEAAIQSWEKSRDFLARQKGYISTKLHRAIRPDGRFQLVNVAQWASPEEFQAATEKMRRELPDTMPQGTVFHPGLYNVVRSDGEPPFAEKFCQGKKHSR